MANGNSGIKRVLREIRDEAAWQLRGFPHRDAKRQLRGFGGETKRQLGGFGAEFARQLFGAGSSHRRRGERR